MIINSVTVTCRNVDIIDLYAGVDADGVTDVPQGGPQVIYYSHIWDVQLNRKDVFIKNWRSCRERVQQRDAEMNYRHF